MDAYIKKQIRSAILFGSAFSVVLALIDLTYGIGFACGILASVIQLVRSSMYIGNILHFQQKRGFGAYLFFTSGIFFLCVPMILGIFYPNWVNLYAAMAGTLFLKYLMFATEILFSKRGD